MKCIMRGPAIYRWMGLYFEVGKYTGPWPLKQDGEPRARAGEGFFLRVQAFMDLPEGEREKFKVGGIGGCIVIGDSGCGAEGNKCK